MGVYCTKCRTVRVMVKPVRVVLANRKIAIQGKCRVCGTKLFRIGK